MTDRALSWVGGKPVVKETPQAPITARQIRLAMAMTPHAAGTLLQAVQTSVATSGIEPLQISWEYAVEWSREAPEIATIGTRLGLSSGQIDALFAQAKTL
jgi:hypothetical protein